MTSLRKLAEGKQCYARLDGCLYSSETVVLAHLRIGNIAGIGQKPPDICALPCCHRCHDVIDGRNNIPINDRERIELLRGLLQWQAWLWNNGHIEATK
jgi:Protein of unknown function (DUF1364)